jgi:glycosyltransferase involved in cell wall biosynthesis
MKVSIVTPSLNQGRYLEATMLSVLNQTYPDIEYIVIDGYSTDGSYDVIQKYADHLAYWVSERDHGQSHALNKGFNKCTGDVFAFLNSDDLLEPEAVSKIVEAFRQEPDAAVIYGRCTNINESGAPISESLGGPITFTEMLKYKMLPKIHQPACFFNRLFLQRAPLFREDLRYAMDYELLLSLMRVHRIRFIDEPVARFRYHDESKTVSQVKAMYREKMRVQWQYGPEYKALWALRYAKYLVRHVLLGN